MNNIPAVRLEISLSKVSKLKLVAGFGALYLLGKYVSYVNSKVNKLEKRVKELEAGADGSDLDKDILEEDFLN